MIQTADNPAETLEGGEYRASDILKLVGLTYRQLHDWEERAGVMASERATAEGWRKFGGEEVIALAVCAAVRRQFALPLEHTRKLYRWLVGKTPSHVEELVVFVGKQTIDSMERSPRFVALLKLRGDDLREALKDDVNRYTFQEYFFAKFKLETTRPIRLAYRLAHFGLPVYLVTDLKAPMILTEFNMVDWIAHRLVDRPVILCPLNDILNAVLKKAGKPRLELDRFSRSFSDTWNELQDRPDLTAAERKVVDLIRAREYQRVTVHVKGGDVIQADVEEDLSEQERARIEKAILDAVGSKGYQTVTLTETGGKVTRLTRRTPISKREMVAEKS